MEYKFSVQKISILPKKNSIADKKEKHEVYILSVNNFFATREKDTTLSPKLLGHHHFINFR